MEEEDTIPASYMPLPEICSETTDKFRWPFGQTRNPYKPKDVTTSLAGPVKSSLKEPSLRYHRQSTYTDAFGEVKPFHIRGYNPESSWLDAVGKHGDFYGDSTYEKDYEWPDEPTKMPVIPLTSTISWGILPLLDTKGTKEEIGSEKEIKTDEKRVESGIVAKDVPLRKKQNVCKGFVPLQEIWLGETTYKRAFLNPPKGWRTKLSKPPVPTLKFSGKIETSTAVMRDYRDPKNVAMKEEDYFVKHPVEDKNNEQSRYPFFIF